VPGVWTNLINRDTEPQTAQQQSVDIFDLLEAGSEIPVNENKRLLATPATYTAPDPSGHSDGTVLGPLLRRRGETVNSITGLFRDRDGVDAVSVTPDVGVSYWVLIDGRWELGGVDSGIDPTQAQDLTIVGYTDADQATTASAPHITTLTPAQARSKHDAILVKGDVGIDGTTLTAGLWYWPKDFTAAGVGDLIKLPAGNQPSRIFLDSTSDTYQVLDDNQDVEIYIDTRGGEVGSQEVLTDGTIQPDAGTAGSTVIAVLWPATMPISKKVTLYDAWGNWDTTSISVGVRDFTVNGVTVTDHVVTYDNRLSSVELVGRNATDITGWEITQVAA
jgi:hypothetical protein